MMSPTISRGLLASRKPPIAEIGVGRLRALEDETLVAAVEAVYDPVR